MIESNLLTGEARDCSFHFTTPFNRIIAVDSRTCGTVRVPILVARLQQLRHPRTVETKHVPDAAYPVHENVGTTTTQSGAVVVNVQ